MGKQSDSKRETFVEGIIENKEFKLQEENNFHNKGTEKLW